jgi:hypothetical protein
MRKMPCCVAQQFLVSCVFESQVELAQVIHCFFLSCSVFLRFDAEVAKTDARGAMDNGMNELKGIFSKSARNHERIRFV